MAATIDPKYFCTRTENLYENSYGTFNFNKLNSIDLYGAELTKKSLSDSDLVLILIADIVVTIVTLQ